MPPKLNTSCNRRRKFLTSTAAGLLAGGYFTLSGAHARSADNATRTASDEDGDVYSVAVPLKTPKSGKDKRVPRPLESAPCSVFIPRGAKTLRGATLNPFYEPTVKQQHWRASAKLWNFAHVGCNLFGVKKDEHSDTVVSALKMLGEASGHPELAHAPLCIHGMSIGGGLTSRLVEAFPSRVIAAAPVCLEVGPRDKPSGGVPMITIFGERDGRQMEKLTEKLPLARAEGAQWAICPQWNRKHEWHMANNIIMPYYEQIIARRLPKAADASAGPVELNAYKESEGWLGNPETWRSPSPEVTPFADYRGDRTQACWLPDGYTSALWQSFVTHNSPLKITSPHGVSGGKPFASFPAGEAVEVQVAVDKDGDVQRLEIFDGNNPLAEVSADTRRATLSDLAAGIYALIAVGTRQDGSRVYSAPHAMVVN